MRQNVYTEPHFLTVIFNQYLYQERKDRKKRINVDAAPEIRRAKKPREQGSSEDKPSQVTSMTFTQTFGETQTSSFGYSLQVPILF